MNFVLMGVLNYSRKLSNTHFIKFLTALREELDVDKNEGRKLLESSSLDENYGGLKEDLEVDVHTIKSVLQDFFFFFACR